jgi:hypothetical protein
MKVYINGYDYSKINEKINLEYDYDIKYTSSYLYTTDGIYLYKDKDKKGKYEKENIKETIKEHEIKKIEYKGETKELTYKQFHFLIDNSKMEYSDLIYHIPYFHLFCEETIYKKNMDGFCFVKINYFDQVDYYFEIDRIEDALFENMITFLSSK